MRTFLFLILGIYSFSVSAQTPAVAPAASAPVVTQSPAPAAPTAVPSPALAVDNNPLAGIIEDYTYNPEGKRDPFAPYESIQGASEGIGPQFPLQKYDLDQLKLVGVIWDVAQPKAMIMDASGKGHVVKANDRIGRNNGYIARIREGEIVVIESFKGADGKTSYQTQVMKLASE